MSVTVEKYEQPEGLFEVIACVYSPKTKEWTCLSAVDLLNRYEPNKHEILEAKGHKFEGTDLELVGFNPSGGKVTWISFDRGTILEELFDDIRSLAKTGKSAWARGRR